MAFGDRTGSPAGPCPSFPTSVISTQKEGSPSCLIPCYLKRSLPFKSRTVIGGVIAVGAGIAGLFGVPVDAGTQASLASTLVDLASAVGGLLAIWGRIKATHTVR